MAVPSGLWPVAGSPVITAVGATLVTVRVKEVVAVRPPASVAVMVTVVGPLGPSGGVYDQSQVPAASFLVTVPSEALSVTVTRPWMSLKVPLLLAGEPSLTVTLAREVVIVGGVLLVSRLTPRGLAVTRSGRRSTLKSPTATETAPPATGTALRKVPWPLPSSTLTSLWLAVTRSGRRSPSKSPTATDRVMLP